MRLLIAAAAAVLAAAPARAGDRFELTVFGGASLLDAESDLTIPIYCFLPGGAEGSVPPPSPDTPVINRPALPTDPVPPGFTTPCPDIVFRQSFGASFLHGTALAYRVTKRAALEATFSVAPSHRLDASNSPYWGFPDSDLTVVAYHIDLAVRYEITTGDTRPFVSFGFGRIEYDGFEGADLLLGLRTDDDEGEWSVNVGAGVDLKLAERLRGRLEVVDHIVTDHFVTGDAEHDVHIRMGITVRP
jgi:hypothetical protein